MRKRHFNNQALSLRQLYQLALEQSFSIVSVVMVGAKKKRVRTPAQQNWNKTKL